MTTIYFKCTLLSDVVINNKLATEGNMETLDYIPGSNFLGIATKLYNDLNPNDAYQIFHSGEVCFGDALPAQGNELSYQIPSMLFIEKGSKDIGAGEAYLHYLLNDTNRPKDRDGNFIQLKQQRSGYASASGIIHPEAKKTFALKSAQDSETRSSKEGAMFGFESLKAGQEFVFSVFFKNLQYIEKVTTALLGTQRVGKSKTAQFGQVNIERIETPKLVDSFSPIGYSLVYAQSNLCFLDDLGQPCLIPTAAQLGFSDDAKIDWGLSQVRTYSYSPWNGKRNTTNIQRDCIAMGSVFYVKTNTISLSTLVGEYQAEGLGRVLINPAFLKGDEKGICSFFKASPTIEFKKKKTDPSPETYLGKYLKKLRDTKSQDKSIALSIQQVLIEDKHSKRLLNISPSQWGGIRAYATKETDLEKLRKLLFDKDTGYLTHGVSYDNYWGKNKEKHLTDLKKIFDTHAKLGNQFLAKYAAEKAKQSR